MNVHEHKDKAKALSVLGARIHAAENGKTPTGRAYAVVTCWGVAIVATVTIYNFPQGRVPDYRVNLTLYRLDEVMEGKLDMLD
ncbi:hypothetical protein ACVXG8_10135 [Escherichia coli]